MPVKIKPKSKTPKRAARPKLTRGRKTEWNVMFYIAGDSMLSASMISQLKQVTDAGFQRDTRVLVYFDPNCNGVDARIFEVNRWRKTRSKRKTFIGDGKDPYVRNIAEDCHIAGLPQIPSALSLRYFLEYSRFAYPAKNYMVFLVGHGVVVGNDSFLPDDDDSSAISLTQLGWILKRFARNVGAEKSEFHLVGFHSCSMNSVELAYELKGSASYMIGTQGVAFPGSWPYRQVLKKIFATIERYRRNKVSATKAGRKRLVEEILTGVQDLSFYNSEDFRFAGYSADLSLCSLDKDKVDALTGPLTQLSRALKKGLSDSATKECILLAHWDSQSYWGEAYSDLYDFCDRLRTYCKASTQEQVSIRNACDGIVELLKSKHRKQSDKGIGDFSRLVVYSDYYGPTYQFSHGLSIYFPWTEPSGKVAENYQDYAFTSKWGSSDSWHSFLTEYFDKTRRPLAGNRKPRSPGLPALMVRPPKPPGMARLERMSDRQVLRLVNPPKSPGMAPSQPPKSPGMAPSKPPKPPGMAPSKPPKPPGMEKPTKPIGQGLYGDTVIKNFTAPEDDTVTSRPKKSRRPRTKPKGKAARKRSKPAKAR